MSTHKSRGIARRLWRFIMLLTAPPGGGALDKLWNYAIGSPQMGKGEVLSRFLLQHWSYRRGGFGLDAAHRGANPQTLGEEWGAGGAKLQFCLFPRVLKEVAMRGWGTAGLTHGGP